LIAGTALGVLNSGILNGNNCGCNNGNRGGILGALFGTGNCGCNDSCGSNVNAAAQGAAAMNALDNKFESKEAAFLRENIARLEAEKYSDGRALGAVAVADHKFESKEAAYLREKIARLEAERYSDNKALEAVAVSDHKFESKESAFLRERIAKLEAERYSDSVAINAYKEAIHLSNKNDEKFSSLYKELAQETAEGRVKEARLQEQIKCLDTTLNMRIDNANERIETSHRECMGEIKCLAHNTREKLEALRDETRAAIALESERRSSGDEKLYCYVNGTFVPGKLVMPLTSICPPAQPATSTTTTTTTTPADGTTTG